MADQPEFESLSDMLLSDSFTPRQKMILAYLQDRWKDEREPTALHYESEVAASFGFPAVVREALDDLVERGVIVPCFYVDLPEKPLRGF